MQSSVGNSVFFLNNVCRILSLRKFKVDFLLEVIDLALGQGGAERPVGKWQRNTIFWWGKYCTRSVANLACATGACIIQDGCST